jgi:hypothetical protein
MHSIGHFYVPHLSIIKYERFLVGCCVFIMTHHCSAIVRHDKRADAANSGVSSVGCQPPNDGPQDSQTNIIKCMHEGCKMGQLVR